MSYDNFFCSLEQKEVADLELEEGRRVLNEMRDSCEKLKEYDRGLEKNFKKEFPGMGFNQLEALAKSFRKRPASEAAANPAAPGMGGSR